LSARDAIDRAGANKPRFNASILSRLGVYYWIPNPELAAVSWIAVQAGARRSFRLSCELMKRLPIVVLLFCCTALAQTAPLSGANTNPAQGSSKPAQPKAAAKPKAAQGRPDEGTLTSGAYSEKFFSLSYTVPEKWFVKTEEMRQGLAGQENAVLLLSVFAKDKPDSGRITSSVTISAESMASYPDVKSAEEYFDELSQVVTSKGFAVLNAPAAIEMGGVNFVRGDFQKQQGDTTAYQATMVALRKGHFLSVTAIAGNQEELTPLLNRVHILAPPTLDKR
jgi:hypothetical protein